MIVPFLDLKAQYQSIKAEIDQKVLEVLSSQSFILGLEVERLEKEMAAYCGTKFAVGVSSGSDALLVSLMALEIGPGDAVITTPFTFFATAGVIARLRAEPIFCDIDEESFNLDPKKLEELLHSLTKKKSFFNIKAIIPVHLFGQCCEMKAILDLAQKYHLFVVEDAAQAISSEYPYGNQVRRAGTMGELSAFSFYPSKNLGGYGDGGMVLTDDEFLARKLVQLRVHGERERYFYDFIGGNFRLDALQAAVLSIKLKYLDFWQEKRRERAQYYDRRFSEEKLVEKEFIELPRPLYKEKLKGRNYHTYHQYVLRAKERDRLYAFLKEKGVGTAIYYPLPLHLQRCFCYLGYKEGDFPAAEKASHEVLALPLYPELTSEQQDYVISTILDFYRQF